MIALPSLLTALVAAGTALWIAYKVYPLQKTADRQVKLDEEKAQVYRAFFDAADDYHNVSKADFRSGKIADFSAYFAELSKAQRALLLYAPENVISACSEYVSSLYSYRYALRKEVEGKAFPKKIKEISRGKAYYQAERHRDAALISTRVDLLGCKLSEAQKAVASVIATQDEDEQDRK